MKAIKIEMTSFSSYLSVWLTVVAWLGGIVLAKGWYALIAMCFPPYAWYLVVEKIMIHFNWT